MVGSRTRRARLWVAVVWACVGVVATATPVFPGAITYPKTRAGEIAEAYFTAFNSADAEKLRAFEEAYRSAGALEKRPIDERVPRLLELRAQVGTLAPAEVTAEKPNSLTILAHAEKPDMWVNCTFSLEVEAPHKLISVAMMPGASPEAKSEYVSEWKDLTDLLEQIRAKTGVPALAAAIIEKGRIADVAVVGERSIGSGNAVARDDRFHVGSITKSMTATMIGALVQKQLVSWDFTVGDILGDMEMRDEYRDVTVEQILQHRGGFPAYTNIGEEEEKRLARLPGSPTGQREAFVAEVLMQAPVAEPGTSMNYSNAGYVVAALMAERIGSRSWEELMRTEVFEPLGMKTAGFGWPATPEHPDQPRGHFKEGDKYRVQEFGEYELGPYLAPAGDVNCSIVDLARYAVAHLRGLAGRDGELDSEIIKRLHSAPPAAGDEMRYAAGWAIVDAPGVGEVHTHSGSAGTFFATIELYPRHNAAVVLATNVGVEAGSAISQEITELFRRRVESE
jgi:D-alanyl-D-alanine carboxypeptidase